jgi:hypothetical protein
MDKKLPIASDERPQADTGRRKAVTYLAVGLGLAVAGMLKPKRAEAYYGRCYQCNCCGFQGSTSQCSNCGHSYSEHSGQQC